MIQNTALQSTYSNPSAKLLLPVFRILHFSCSSVLPWLHFSILLLISCLKDPETPEAHRYRDGLKTGECAAIKDIALRDDCWLAAVQRKKGSKKLPEDPCSRISAEQIQQECWFALAERKKDVTLCLSAGSFRDDCVLHILSQSFVLWVDPATIPGGVQEEEMALRIKQTGMDPSDPRPWSAWYRWVLGQRLPLDRGACGRVEDVFRREACMATGVALYNDRLNRARDRGSYPCPAPGSAGLPPDLQYTPDGDLDTLRASRSDLCP